MDGLAAGRRAGDGLTTGEAMRMAPLHEDTSMERPPEVERLIDDAIRAGFEVKATGLMRQILLIGRPKGDGPNLILFSDMTAQRTDGGRPEMLRSYAAIREALGLAPGESHQDPSGREGPPAGYRAERPRMPQERPAGRSEGQEEAHTTNKCEQLCNSVSYGKPRTGEIGVEVSEWGMVTLRGTLYLTCGKCGRDLKSAKLEVEMDAYHEFPRLKYWDGIPPEEYMSFEAVGEAKVKATGRNEATDRPGRPTKKSHYFGVKATVRVRRSVSTPEGDHAEIHEKTITIAVDEQESSFEEC